MCLEYKHRSNLSTDKLMTVKPGRSNQELTATLDSRCTRRLDQRHIVSLALTKRREFPGLQGNYSSCPDITHRAPSSIQLADTIRKCQEYTSRKTMPLKSGYEYLRERRFTAQWSIVMQEMLALGASHAGCLRPDSSFTLPC